MPQFAPDRPFRADLCEMEIKLYSNSYHKEY